MPRKSPAILGANKVGEYGLRVYGRTVTLVQCRKGFALEDVYSWCSRSSRGAIRKACKELGWIAQAWLDEYALVRHFVNRMDRERRKLEYRNRKGQQR